MTQRIGKYLTARLLPSPAGRKTSQWAILGNDGTELGRVAWYSSWRQYNFDPTFGATFLEKLNSEHRAQKASA